MRRETLSCEALVIGSGPGGATTAALLAEAGVDVILLEEGRDLALDSAPAHSLAEMAQKYRNDGLTPALGKTKVTYVEGRCVGGASEINAGLYHRPAAETLDRWARDHALDDFGGDALAPHIAAVEEQVGVSLRPGGVGPHSTKLIEGAEQLGWKHGEIARFWRYPDGDKMGVRRSMRETFVPRAIAAGARLQARTRVEQLIHRGGRVTGATGVQQTDSGPVRVTVQSPATFVCAGAIQSPMLLRRSGLRGRVGDTLALNPMIRVAARFPEPMNDPHLGVPVQQVEHFKPTMTLGCSHSSLAHLALWMPGGPIERAAALEDWSRTAIFYVKIMASDRGVVRNLPVFREALVRFPVSPADLKLLGLGLSRLARLLFAAGAEYLFSPLVGGEPLTSASQAQALESAVTYENASLSAIHLHATCPMGGNGTAGITDSHGAVKGVDGLWLNDSSILPETPGINPQGLILALARRNAMRWLDSC